MMPSKPGAGSVVTTSWCQTCGGSTMTVRPVSSRSSRRKAVSESSPGSMPPPGAAHALRLFRHCRVREDEPAQQYAVVLVEHDRTDGPAQVRRHGTSDAAPRRTMIDISWRLSALTRSLYLAVGAVLINLVSLPQLWFGDAGFEVGDATGRRRGCYRRRRPGSRRNPGQPRDHEGSFPPAEEYGLVRI